MGRVLAVAVSPAIDCVAVAPGATRGGTSRVTEVHDTPGGKGVHVAQVAARLGASVTLVLPVGGRRGEQLIDALGDTAVDVRAVTVGGETRRTYTVIDRESDRESLELLEPMASLAEHEQHALVETVRASAADAAVAVISGGLPAPFGASLYADLVDAARNGGAFVIADTSGHALSSACARGVDLVTPNVSEAAAVLGANLPEDLVAIAKLGDGMRALGAGAAWVSAGRLGSLLATPEQRFHLHVNGEVDVVNPVGCGDALVGGLAVALARGDDLRSATAFGSAAATEKLRHLHPAMVDRQAVEALMGLIQVDLLETVAG